jgi:DNA primase
MNGMIRKDIEEKEKEKKREIDGDKKELEGDRSQNSEADIHTSSNSFYLHLTSSNSSPSAEVERLLIQSVIRHGEEIIFEHIETEDGGQISMNVAQYVDYDLGSDGLLFHDERYNQILREAVEHSGEEGFKAETYFMHHPDADISHLATQLAIDRHQLGRGFQVKQREGSLRQHVQHLVLDLRMDIVEKRLKEIQKEMRQAGSDMERVRELMEEFKSAQELRNALAKQLGNDLIL